jgi:hypothetical protein
MTECPCPDANENNCAKCQELPIWYFKQNKPEDPLIKLKRYLENKRMINPPEKHK